jgi:hypothetical protein
MKEDMTRGSVIVSWSAIHGQPVMLVGRKVKGRILIVNTFGGEEARELYEKLTENSPLVVRDSKGAVMEEVKTDEN